MDSMNQVQDHVGGSLSDKLILVSVLGVTPDRLGRAGIPSLCYSTAEQRRISNNYRMAVLATLSVITLT